MQENKFKLMTINAQGLNNQEKRKKFLKWIQQQQPDILLLQETKCATHEKGKDWMFGQHFKHHWSCGGFSRSGTAILLSEKFHKEVTDLQFVTKSDRIMWIKFIWGARRWKIVNIYAPDNPPDRIRFLEDLGGEVVEDEDEDEGEDQEYAQMRIIEDILFVAGDWNFVENGSLDKIGNPRTGTLGSLPFSDFAAQFSLEDLWRRRNPQALETTWMRRNPTLVASRIDRIYSSTDSRHLIESISHFDYPLSDHNGVQAVITLPGGWEIGPGYWKFNRKILSNPQFDQQVKLLLAAIPKKDLLTEWDTFKEEVKKEAIMASKSMKREKEKITKELQEKIQEIEKIATSQVLNDLLSDEYARCKKLLKDLEEEKVEGAIIRARVRTVFEGSKPGNFFSRLERKRGAQNMILALTDEHGERKEEIQDILQIASNFYSELYGETEPDPVAIGEVLQSIPRRVEKTDRDLLEKDIDLDEVIEAINRSGKNRSPGPDGLTSDFYVHHQTTIAPILTRLFNEIQERESLSKTQAESILSLIYKKGDEAEIRNYRPISLLNVDQKILTKILANRLNQALPKLIHSDQKQVKGRWMQENSRLMLDVIYHLNISHGKGGIVFLDQEKAFDRLDWTFMKETLKTFGFGPNFIRWIDILYSNPSMRIKINNFLSDPIKIRRGVRQGDPLSPLLYVICIEGLACMIRRSKGIHGIQIPDGKTLKTLLYADDMTIFFTTNDEILELRSILDTYQKASNSKLNWGKCEGLLFRIKKPPDWLWEGKWLGRGDVFRYLGTPISADLNLNKLWSQAIQDLGSTNWNKHYLTLIGRKVVINSYLIPKLSFLLQVLPLTNMLRAKIETVLFGILWKGKKQGLIRRETCHLSIQDGGLGILSVSAIEKASLVKWITRYIRNMESQEPWIQIARFYLVNRASAWGTGNLSLLQTLPRKNFACPPFWMNALEAWEEMGGKLNLTDLSLAQVLELPIFFNRSLPSFQRIYDPARLAKHGIVKFLDLTHDFDWASPADLLQTKGILMSLPELWHLHGLVEIDFGDEQGDANHWKILNKLEVKGKRIMEMTPKQIRIHFTPSGIPPATLIWKDEGFTLLPQTWKDLWKAKVPVRLNEHFFLLLHRALWTGSKAKEKGFTKIPTDCQLCPGSEETLVHLFWECPRAKAIWSLFLDTRPRLSWEEVLNDDIEQRDSRIALWVIWTSRCSHLYGREPHVPKKDQSTFADLLKLFS